MDTSYGLAYFEMEDYCNQILHAGGKIAVSAGATVSHHRVPLQVPWGCDKHRSVNGQTGHIFTINGRSLKTL